MGIINSELQTYAPAPQTLELPGHTASNVLYVVQQTKNFYAANKRELAVTVDLMDREESPLSCHQYFDDIAQRNGTAAYPDQRNQVLAITREMYGYAYKSQIDLADLSRLNDNFSELPANHRSSLYRAGAWMMIGATGVKQYMRFSDLKFLAETGEPRSIPFDPLRVTSERPDVYEPIDVYTAPRPALNVALWMKKMSRNVSVGHARDHIYEVIDDQTNRFEFWTSKLREAYEYRAVRSIAGMALRNLGIEEG